MQPPAATSALFAEGQTIAYVRIAGTVISPVDLGKAIADTRAKVVYKSDQALPNQEVRVEEIDVAGLKGHLKADYEAAGGSIRLESLLQYLMYVLVIQIKSHSR